MTLWKGWLQGLAGLGSTFVELIPNEKRTRRAWTAYAVEKGQRGLESAHRWLEKGSGVGLLISPPLWVLDADSESEVERIVSACLVARITPLLVRTPSGGAHFYFRLPDGFQREHLKNHLCHPKDEDGNKVEADWKFGPRTMVVAPGSSRNGKGYLPDQPWTMPPVADPCMFLPNGRFWREHHPFLVDTRPLKDRLARARFYLASRAPIAVSERSGHKVLAGVCAHLVAYLDLDPGAAFHLLTHGDQPWNKRCIDLDGKPCPWSNTALWNACTAAVDSVPAAGAKAWERAEADREVQGRLDELVGCLKQSMTLSGTVRVPVERIRRLFERFNITDLTPKWFGDELSKQGIKRIRATGARVQCAPMLDYRALVNAILDQRRVQLTQERWRGGCALIQHESSLERMLSDK